MQLIQLTIICLLIATTHAADSDYPEELRSHMNFGVQPCDTFYNFTCGKWIRKQKSSESVPKLELAYDFLKERTKKVIHHIVTKENLSLVSTFYASCINIHTINEYSNIQPFKDDLDRIENAEDTKNLFEIAGEFARNGAHTIFQLDVEPAPNQKLQLVTKFIGLTLPKSMDEKVKDYYDEEEVLKAYRRYIETIMEWSGYKRSAEVADIVIRIEKQIGQLSRDPFSKLEYISIEKAQTLWPLTFGAYMKGMKITIKSRPKKRLIIFKTRSTKRSEVVGVSDQLLMDNTEEIVRHTPLAELQAYVAFITIHSRIHGLGYDFLNVHFELFGKRIKCLKKPISRQEFCVQSQLDYLPRLIGSYFYEATIKDEDKFRIDMMTDLIKFMLETRIFNYCKVWIDDSSCGAMIKHLDNIRTVIPYSKVNRKKVYPFTLSRGRYAGNIYTILSHSFQKFDKIGERVDYRESMYPPDEVYAHYSINENKIELPIAMFQPPMFYDESKHPALTFGAIGAVYAHKLTNSFHVDTHPRDRNGKIARWWTDTTRNEFRTRSNCIKDEYSRPDTIKENIGDISGLSLAWDTYKEHMKDTMPKTTPELATQGERMFFVAFGQSLCSLYDERTMKEHIRTRTADERRVNGAIQHNPSFPSSFECPNDTPMNTLPKCKVW